MGAFEEIAGFLVLSGLIYWFMIIVAIAIMFAFVAGLAKRKYGFVRLPYVHFPYRVEKYRYKGPLENVDFFNVPEAYLELFAIDRARIHTFPTEEGASIFKLVLQGNIFNLKEAPKYLLPSENIDWGMKTIKLVYKSEIDEPVAIPPRVRRGQFVLPTGLTESQRATTLANYRNVYNRAQTKEPNWWAQHGSWVVALMFVVVVMAIQAWSMDGIGKSNAKAAEATASGTERLAMAMENLTHTVGPMLEFQQSQQEPGATPPPWEDP